LCGKGTTRAASVRSCEKLPLCPVELMSAGSKIDPSMAKAKPISDSSSASGIAYIRRGKKLLHNSSSSQKRGVRLCERNNSADTKVREE